MAFSLNTGKDQIQALKSLQGYFQGIYVKNTQSDNDAGKTEMIYNKLKHTNAPQDHAGPHTETQDRPFIKPTQAAQTGLEAFGLRA